MEKDTINGNLKGIKSQAMYSLKKLHSFSNHIHFKKFHSFLKMLWLNMKQRSGRSYTQPYFVVVSITYPFYIFGTTLIKQMNTFTLERKIRPAKKPIGPENIGIAGSQKTVTGRGSSHISIYKGL